MEIQVHSVDVGKDKTKGHTMRVWEAQSKVQLETGIRPIHISACEDAPPYEREKSWEGITEFRRTADVWLSEFEVLLILAEVLPTGLPLLKPQTCLKLARYFLERAIAQAQLDSPQSATVPASVVSDYGKSKGFDDPQGDLEPNDYLEMTIDALNQVRSATEARLSSHLEKMAREIRARQNSEAAVP